MLIKQFKYSSDNLAYLIYSKNVGIAIDPGAVKDILHFIEKNNIKIKYVTNTHSHYDHVPGNGEILKQTQAEFIDCKKIKSDKTIILGKEKLEIFHTPGHSEDSIVFKGDEFIVTGDTLFNGTIGNCFTGDLKAFFLSLKRLMGFPGNTKIYSGHDYVMESLAIAKTIEKDNLDIDLYMKKYNSKLVVSSLNDELMVNPFIRFNSSSMTDILKAKAMPTGTEFERFQSIMEIY